MSGVSLTCFVALVLTNQVMSMMISDVLGRALSDPQPPPEEPPAACLELVVAGMAAYDMYIDLTPQGVIEATNAQLPIDLNLTDRSAVEAFLCDLAGVNGFSELSQLVGLSESVLRRWYQVMQQYLLTYGQAQGEQGVRDILRLYAIWTDVVDFAAQVGFNPKEPHFLHAYGSEGSSSRSSEEQEQLVVEPADARSFIDGMAAEYGDDFANDVFNFVGRIGPMRSAEPVNVDLEDLYTAIVESKTNAEFAATINVPGMLVTNLFYAIAGMNAEPSPDSDNTTMDILDVEMNLVSVLLDLGFYAWE